MKDEWYRRLWTLIFLAYCVRLNTLLFKNGLPIRGSIEAGIFYKQNQILAGSPLINAYKLSESLSFAGVTLTPKTESWIKSIDTDGAILGLFTGCVKVPTKKGKLTLVCLKHPDLLKIEKSKTDLRDFVYKKFSAHGKETSIDVLDKLENTIEFLSDKKINS